MSSGPTGQGEPPLLRVVRGEPTAEELAALVGVLAALAARAVPAPGRTPSAGGVGGWADRRAGVRRPLPHGPGGWRAAARGW